MRFLSRFAYWLALPLKCKFGAHVFDPGEHGFGFGRIDYFCRRCQQLIRSIPLEDATPEDVANLKRLRRLIDQVPRERQPTRTTDHPQV